MADNLGVTPEKRYNANTDPQTYARALVIRQIHDKWDKTTEPLEYQIFVVWYAFILGGWKCLLSTTLPDGKYYEVTYNQEDCEAYVDTYVKVDNVCVPD